MNISFNPWVWVAAFLTLSMMSFLYKDNIFYKIGEHIYVGSSAAFMLIYLWYFDVKPKLVDGFMYNTGINKWILIIPALLSLFMLMRFIRPVAWISRWAIAFTVGMGSGLGITGLLQGFLVPQIKATFLPLYVHGSNTLMSIYLSLNNILMVVGTLSAIVYFYFSKEHTGPVKKISQVGITFIMVAFGASFGYTVMARISLLIGRVYFLLHNWLGLV